MRATLLVLVVFGLVLTGCAGGESSEGRAGNERSEGTGQRLPAASLEALSGGAPLELDRVRGPAVLNFWASWCGPCRRELPVFQDFHERYPGVRVLGIDFQDRQPDAAAALVRETGAAYPMYVDPLGDLSGREPFPTLRGLPYTALVDARGRLVHGEFAEIEDLTQLETMVRRHLGREVLS